MQRNKSIKKKKEESMSPKTKNSYQKHKEESEYFKDFKTLRINTELDLSEEETK
jgi:hypothetical protein